MKAPVVALACLVTTACGAGEGANGGAGADQDDAALHLLTVQQTYAPEGGVMYIEGAVAEVQLLDADGAVRTTTGDPSQPLTFEGLPAGRYTVRPGLLPCEANCGNLGTRTDACEVEVAIPAETVARVVYIPTKSCEAINP